MRGVELGFAESGRFFFGESTEVACALVDRGAGDLIGESSGLRAGTRGVGKNMEVGERETVDEVEGGRVIGGGFAGKTADDVGADGGVGEMFANELDAAGVMFGAIPAVHGGEDAVGAGLQGHVKVLGNAPRGCKERDEILRDVERLDRAYAKPGDIGFVEDVSEKLLEFDAGREIAAVGAEVDAAEDDFFVAGVGEMTDFLDDFVGREAAAFAADEGDDAVGAAAVAAVLNFQRGASGVGFAAENWRGEEFGSGERCRR